MEAEQLQATERVGVDWERTDRLWREKGGFVPRRDEYRCASAGAGCGTLRNQAGSGNAERGYQAHGGSDLLRKLLQDSDRLWYVDAPQIKIDNCIRAQPMRRDAWAERFQEGHQARAD